MKIKFYAHASFRLEGDGLGDLAQAVLPSLARAGDG